MSTIRQLGEKYGGIISEFVVRCDEEGLDCETEDTKSEMFNELISALKEGKLLTQKQASYSCSETLYRETRERTCYELSKRSRRGDTEGVEKIGEGWSELWYMFIPVARTSGIKLCWTNQNQLFY